MFSNEHIEQARRSETVREGESNIHNNSDSGNNTVQTLVGVFHETIEMKGKKKRSEQTIANTLERIERSLQLVELRWLMAQSMVALDVLLLKIQEMYQRTIKLRHSMLW